MHLFPEEKPANPAHFDPGGIKETGGEDGRSGTASARGSRAGSSGYPAK